MTDAVISVTTIAAMRFIPVPPIGIRESYTTIGTLDATCPIAFRPPAPQATTRWIVRLKPDATPGGYTSNPLGFRCIRQGALLGARRAQDVTQAVVALVTFVKLDRLRVIQRERHRERPRLRPGLGIVERHRPAQLVRSDLCESLGNLEGVGVGVAVDAPLGEVGRFDDEGIALPVAAGVAHVEVNVPARVRAWILVDRDEARLVNHLVLNGDIPRPLHDARGVPVDRRHA